MSNDVLLVPINIEQPNVEAQSDVVVYVPQAHKNKAGIVKEGEGINIENGVVSLDTQTVEDMIDANKWVSYGFQQNLTEDEKGMARHNIGAGDNDFTGSYYDVTQKPHLNTDNTNSLLSGDEEINNTINLHKVSKTGSFNDLNDVPYETLDFAEAERQKSKNLLYIVRTQDTENINAYPDHMIVNGTPGSYGQYPYQSSSLPTGVKFESGKTYTLSRQLISGDGSLNFKLGFALQDISGHALQEVLIPSGQNSVTFECNNNDTTNYACYVVFDGDETFTNAYYGLQLEEDTIATGYRPYNGAIVHQKDIEGFRGKVLWTNPNPQGAFSSQQITLSDGDYDFLLYFVNLYGSSDSDEMIFSVIVEKGKSALFNIAADYASNQATFYRTATYISETIINFSQGTYRYTGTSGTDASICVPVKIIGYKRS